MNFSWNEVIQYIEHNIPPEPEYLLKLRRYTHWNTVYWPMMSSPAQGFFLRLISSITRPQQVLELGTYTGYSALCLAEGLQKNGKLITLDSNAETNRIANKFFELYGKGNIELLEYDINFWLDRHSDEAFDLIFVDADKEQGVNYYHKCINLLRSGGVMIIDNMLWKGWVFSDTPPDEASRSISELTRLLITDSRVLPAWVPLRDGMIVLQKK